MKKIYDEISSEELKALTSAIRTRYGIDFTNYEIKSLKRGFARLIGKNEMNSLLDLWGRILRDRDFFNHCVDDLTVNLTELFRNPEIWIRLKDDILDQKKNQLRIDIWHAGCSTGEEVYSMAYLLDLKALLKKGYIMGTDLSSKALSKAMEAKYSTTLSEKYQKGLMTFLPNGNINSLFRQDEKFIYVREKYKKNIKFQVHNLVSDPMKGRFDIIFCRNVMIYFDERLKTKVLTLFHQSLKEDGFFVIGYYDMLPDLSKELFELYDPKTRIYRKKA